MIELFIKVVEEDSRDRCLAQAYISVNESEPFLLVEKESEVLRRCSEIPGFKIEEGIRRQPEGFLSQAAIFQIGYFHRGIIIRFAVFMQ